MESEKTFSLPRTLLAAGFIIMSAAAGLGFMKYRSNQLHTDTTALSDTTNQQEIAPSSESTQTEIEQQAEAKAPDAATVTTETTATDETPSILSCENCTLASVDKLHSLPSTYAPEVISVNLSGGGMLTQSANDGLTDLFAAASASGNRLEIISSYRSYATQQSTFAYWVSTEEAKGLSQLEAEAEANTYSAKAGQSEHQLGTTADLKCAGCESFNAAQNADAYKFIAANAHLYGFAISYPINQDELTGYTYEPWHIRWIGIDLASELYDTGYITGNGNYLAQFLRNKSPN